jgi:hypothetical protein
MEMEDELFCVIIWRKCREEDCYIHKQCKKYLQWKSSMKEAKP